MKTGCPMLIIAPPKEFTKLKRLESIDLSKEAENRLRFIDWYNTQLPRFSKNKKRSASLICRHFGLERSYFYRWLKRFKDYRLKGLEEHSHRPKHLRKAEYDLKLVAKTRAIRIEHPTYSAKKIKIILNISKSVSTITRIIKRFNLYFIGKDIKRRAKRNKKHINNRIDTTKRATSPCQIIEFDMSEKLNKNICELVCKSSYEYFERNKFSDQENYMKHINLLASKFYAMCSIDQYTRRVFVHISSPSKSSQAVIALEKTMYTLLKS